MSSEKPLWAVNIQGPDDLIAVASYDEAIKIANAFNDWWSGFVALGQYREPHSPRMWAVPTEWNGDASSHNSADRSHEYAWLFEDVNGASDMSSEKHTLGPWKADWIGGTAVITSRNAVIVELPYRGDEIDQKAIAHLIAAAPAMFDYIAKMASEGDLQASKIMEAIRGNS